MLIIYHNPKCSKSRETLAIIREQGIEPVIIEYLTSPIRAAEIRELLTKSGLRAEQAVRTDHEIYFSHIEHKHLNDDEIIALIVQNPSLLNRPFVVSEKGAKLCRPPESVRELF